MIQALGTEGRKSKGESFMHISIHKRTQNKAYIMKMLFRSGGTYFRNVAFHASGVINFHVERLFLLLFFNSDQE